MKIRSFIAINLPDSLKKEISFLIEKLKKENRKLPIKWVSWEGLHVTLHFLGSQEESLLEKVGEAIEKLKFKIENLKLELKLEKIDAFPNLIKPRVLFIQVKEVGGEKLINFQKELGRELEKLGIEIDRRPWTAHLTLARLKIPTPLKIPKFEICSPRLRESEAGNLKFKVCSIDLMKSELTPTGARYSILKSFKL